MANWKMGHLDVESIRKFFFYLEEVKFQAKFQVGVAPQAIHLPLVVELASKFGFRVGAQDCSPHAQGAYTGEIACGALFDLGVSFVLVGHSERRLHHGEGHGLLKSKVDMALGAGLDVIFCVGESDRQRQEGQTQQVLATQLKEGLGGDLAGHAQRITVAYEPVWAIGTGRAATAREARRAHGEIRRVLKELWGPGVLGPSPILYGGSVTPQNIGGLLADPFIDGALVGGASLRPESFVSLFEHCSSVGK